MKSLLELNPTLTKEWHPTKKGALTPADLSPGSNKKVWWICAKGHEWQAMSNSRCSGRGCPYCSGNRVTAETCLKTINPKLSSEWHTTRNGTLTPEDVSRGSTKRVWWVCSRGHEWQTQVYHRSRGTGCPYCAGQAVGKNNCLQAINPELAKQWHPSRNEGLSPRDVAPSTDKKAWWICDRGHEWQATISNRNRGRGCPYCAGRAVCEDNSLQTLNSALAAEWHPERNDKLTSRDVTPGSSKKVWWQCESGHEWEAIINSRSKGYGKCPYCGGRRKA